MLGRLSREVGSVYFFKKNSLQTFAHRELYNACFVLIDESIADSETLLVMIFLFQLIYHCHSIVFH